MTNQKITVMQVIGNLQIGGAQEVVRTLVESLPVDECQSIVCTLRDGAVRQEIEEAGIQVEVLTGRNHSVLDFPRFIADHIRLAKELTFIIKKYDVDVVQTHLMGSFIYVVMFLRFITPLSVVIWTFHNVGFEITSARLSRHQWMLKPKRFVNRLLYRLCSHLVNGFVAVSEQVEQAVIMVVGSIKPKITVICNGVDTKRFDKPVDVALVRSQLGLNMNQYLIAVVATLKEQKGHRYLIDALSSIVHRHPEVHTIFIGDGPLMDELCLQVGELQLGDHVHFLGNRCDIPALLGASDMFVLPSLWEGLPMALLEAMSARLPVVASEVSGTVQVVVPYESGVLVPPGDTRQLANAIEGLINDPGAASAIGEAARLRVEKKFSANKQAMEHLVLYRDLMKKVKKI